MFRIFRIPKNHIRTQNFLNTSSRYHSSWKHNRKHGQHQEGHNDHHGILNVRHHVSYLHGAAVNASGSFIHDEHGNAVHNKHHRRHHKGHAPVDKQIHFPEVFIGFLKPLFFPLFPAECPDDRNSLKNLTGYQV